MTQHRRYLYPDLIDARAECGYLAAGRSGKVDGHDRKTAARAYKERKAAPGIYAVRCLATGAAWVGRASDLATMQNRVWFTLRLGSNPHRALQAAWREHGESRFAFEELEQLDDDLSPGTRDLMLKKRREHWAVELDACAI